MRENGRLNIIYKTRSDRSSLSTLYRSLHCVKLAIIPSMYHLPPYSHPNSYTRSHISSKSGKVIWVENSLENETSRYIMVACIYVYPYVFTAVWMRFLGETGSLILFDSIYTCNRSLRHSHKLKLSEGTKMRIQQTNSKSLFV